MSPIEARRAVGQPDILERLREPLTMSMFATSSALHAEQYSQRQDALAEIERLHTMVAALNHDSSMARIEIDRLRTALRAVRASTDPVWANQIIRDALREGEGT
jgi:hypothetical protein